METIQQIHTTASQQILQARFLATLKKIQYVSYSHIMLNSYRKNMVACLERNSKLLSESVLKTATNNYGVIL